MKQVIRIIMTGIIFLVILCITFFADAIVLRRGLLHHPYIPGYSDWLDRALLIVTLGIPVAVAIRCYKWMGKAMKKDTSRELPE